MFSLRTRKWDARIVIVECAGEFHLFRLLLFYGAVRPGYINPFMLKTLS